MPTTPRTKPTEGFVVVQQGGASNEVYVHAFDTKKQVATYRRSCARAAYACSPGIPVPMSVLENNKALGAMEDVAKAAAKLVFGQ